MDSQAARPIRPEQPLFESPPHSRIFVTILLLPQTSQDCSVSVDFESKPKMGGAVAVMTLNLMKTKKSIVSLTQEQRAEQIKRVGREIAAARSSVKQAKINLKRAKKAAKQAKKRFKKARKQYKVLLKEFQRSPKKTATQKAVAATKSTASRGSRKRPVLRKLPLAPRIVRKGTAASPKSVVPGTTTLTGGKILLGTPPAGQEPAVLKIPRSSNASALGS